MNEMPRSRNLLKAARDFRDLLNRNYPRRASLELVGNRYQLSSDQRHLLHRGVFSNRQSAFRAKRRIPFRAVKGKDLAIDGYNVLITIEAALSGRPLISADDGFLRDISGISRNFKKTTGTKQALQWIYETLKRMKPHRSLFLLDAPISKSGKLAEEARTQFKEVGIPGDAQAIPVPEKILIGFSGIVATSDTAIIDRTKKIFDLAGFVIRRKIPSASILHLHHPPKTPGG